MAAEHQVNAGVAALPPLGDETYYQALFQIIQDAQAAGSVVQIVTIWPAQSTENRPGEVKPMDCKPSGNCPK